MLLSFSGVQAAAFYLSPLRTRTVTSDACQQPQHSCYRVNGGDTQENTTILTPPLPVDGQKKEAATYKGGNKRQRNYSLVLINFYWNLMGGGGGRWLRNKTGLAKSQEGHQRPTLPL